MMTVYVNEDDKYEIFTQIAYVGQVSGGIEFNEVQINRIADRSRKKCCEGKMFGAFLINGEVTYKDRDQMGYISHLVKDVFIIDRIMFCHICLIATERGKLLEMYLDKYLNKCDSTFEVRDLVVDCVGSGSLLVDDEFEIVRIDILYSH